MANDNAKGSYKSLGQVFKELAQNHKDWANHLSSFTSGLMSAGMLISSFNGLIDTLKDPDASGWEKFSSVLMSVSMIMMSVSGTVKGLTSAWELLKIVTDKDTLAKGANAIAAWLQAKAQREVNKEKKEEVVTNAAAATSEGVAAAANMVNAATEEAEAKASQKAAAADAAETTGNY
jgi:hypothetical protein